jgi:hypothetical protein
MTHKGGRHEMFIIIKVAFIVFVCGCLSDIVAVSSRLSGVNLINQTADDDILQALNLASV